MIIRLVFFILITLKGIDRLLFASIWAEDGKVFLKHAFEIGWSSLLLPYDGYFHTIPRVISIAATWLPISLIPYFIVIVCYVIVTYTITLIFCEPYQWLFKNNKKMTFICSLLLLLVPGQIVILGNTANLHWYLLLIIAIIGLKNINQPYTITELIIVSLCILSEGAAIILLPLFITRIFLKKGQKNWHSFGDYYIIFFIILFAFIHISIADTTRGPFLFSEYIKIFVDQLCYFFVLHIFIGDNLLNYIQDNEAILKSAAFLIILGVIFFLKKNWQKEMLLPVVLAFCALLLPIMIIMVRPQNSEILKTYFTYNVYEWFRFRYSFFIPAVASIFWISIISRVPQPNWFPFILVSLIVFIHVFLNSHRLPIYRYSENRDWFEKAPLLEKSINEGCPPTVRVQINPKNWSVLFRSPIENDCNKNSAEK